MLVIMLRKENDFRWIELIIICKISKVIIEGLKSGKLNFKIN